MSVLDAMVRAVVNSARKPGIDMANKILELRQQGRANEVTNEMMEAADQEYLTKNYPLPMDFDSRMQRAMDLGYDMDVFYRGTPRPMNAKRPSDVWSSDNPYVGSTYSTYRYEPNNTYYEGGPVLTPVITRTDGMATIDAKGNTFAGIPYSSMVDAKLRPPTDAPDAAMPTYRTDDVVYEARGEDGYAARGVEFQNIIDRGGQTLGMIDRETGRLIPDLEAQAATRVPSRVRTNTPEDVRSIFGRFDPEMRHLRHLSSGVVAGAGLPYIIEKYLEEAANE